MIGWPLTVVGSIPLLALMHVAWRSMRCNLNRLRDARRLAPLDGLDLSGASVAPVPTPPRWPDVDSVDEPAVAAAYASLAEARAATWAVAGEAVVVAAGAVLGVLLTRTFPLTWVDSASVGGALGFGICGMLARAQAATLWTPLAARYRARYAVLTATPEPAPEPPRRPWWSRLVPSRTRRTR
ncbi:MAG TPA: hypothetical protein VNA20_05675 [Frankiaceae bacterium]|nr:hypothetical protein [Frankiaceae bacterium]